MGLDESDDDFGIQGSGSSIDEDVVNLEVGNSVLKGLLSVSESITIDTVAGFFF